MSGDARSAEQAARRVSSGATRVSRAWRKLPTERRLAVAAALGLFLSLFLPWYQDTVILSGTGRAAGLRLTNASITGWGAFSFVEAAVLLVAAGVLTLLFMRAEGRAFHVPGGDGGVITAAGAWTCLLIVWRIFDKQGSQSNHGQYLTSTGIEWGIFIALGVAGLLGYAGSRIRLAHEPEPPLPGEGPAPARGARAAVAAGLGKPRPRPPRPVAAGEPWPDEAPTRRAQPDEAPTLWTPSDEAPTLWTPSDESPTGRTASDEQPPIRKPSDQAPTERTPPDQAPTDRTPPDQAPTERTRPDQAPTERTRPDQAPTQRTAPDQAPTRPLRAAGEAPTRRSRSEDKPRPAPGFEFPDVEEIDFEDPPTARLSRSARRARPSGAGIPPTEEQVPTRVDPRPD